MNCVARELHHGHLRTRCDRASRFPRRSRSILAFWRERDVFRRSVEERPADRIFTFYEGPPTANGNPGIHHVLARVFKDLIPRYQTMQGYRVPRKGGWDTHGLPVELEVEKELGLNAKPRDRGSTASRSSTRSAASPSSATSRSGSA